MFNRRCLCFPKSCGGVFFGKPKTFGTPLYSPWKKVWIDFPKTDNSKIKHAYLNTAWFNKAKNIPINISRHNKGVDFYLIFNMAPIRVYHSLNFCRHVFHDIFKKFHVYSGPFFFDNTDQLLSVSHYPFLVNHHF